jgi:hypothetical protein
LKSGYVGCFATAMPNSGIGGIPPFLADFVSRLMVTIANAW